MHGNADRNASIVVGKRLLARYQQNVSKEKPHAPLVTERPVKTGVFAVPRSPKAMEGHLLTLPGMERRTRRAPVRRIGGRN